MQDTKASGRLIEMLYDIAGDPDAPANSRLSAIKEILDRTLGKSSTLAGPDDSPPPPEIIFRIVDARTGTAPDTQSNTT